MIRSLVGHGIGRDMHEDPQIPNFGEPGKGPELEEGMVLAIEPMVNVGTPEIRMGNDGWAVYCRTTRWPPTSSSPSRSRPTGRESSLLARRRVALEDVRIAPWARTGGAPSMTMSASLLAPHDEALDRALEASAAAGLPGDPSHRATGQAARPAGRIDRGADDPRVRHPRPATARSGWPGRSPRTVA